MLSFSDRASEKVREFLMQDPTAQGKLLRVFARPGGCSGFEYGVTFDEAKDGDEVVQFESFQVVVDPQSAIYVANLEIDYKQSLQESTFTFANKKAKSSCGCGISFEF